MELAAFRYGIALPGWFNLGAKAYEQARNRYNLEAHFDLQELLTNFGSTRFHGGLNLAANLLGKPGKMDVQGHMVQDLYDAGRHAEIDDYCRCDALDQEQAIIEETKQWLESKAPQQRAYQLYLERWGPWHNPWLTS